MWDSTCLGHPDPRQCQMSPCRSHRDPAIEATGHNCRRCKNPIQAPAGPLKGTPSHLVALMAVVSVARSLAWGGGGSELSGNSRSTASPSDGKGMSLSWSHSDGYLTQSTVGNGTHLTKHDPKGFAVLGIPKSPAITVDIGQLRCEFHAATRARPASVLPQE